MIPNRSVLVVRSMLLTAVVMVAVVAPAFSLSEDESRQLKPGEAFVNVRFTTDVGQPIRSIEKHEIVLSIGGEEGR